MSQMDRYARSSRNQQLDGARSVALAVAITLALGAGACEPGGASGGDVVRAQVMQVEGTEGALTFQATAEDQVRTLTVSGAGASLEMKLTDGDGALLAHAHRTEDGGAELTMGNDVLTATAGKLLEPPTDAVQADPLTWALMDGRVVDLLLDAPAETRDAESLLRSALEVTAAEGEAIDVTLEGAQVALQRAEPADPASASIQGGLNLGELPHQDATHVATSGVPGTMTAGQKASACVTMKNTGTLKWTAAWNIKLGSQSPQDGTTWGLNRVALPSSVTVAPGSSRAFCFTITAPATPGTYGFQWRMVQEGVAWFGQTSPLKWVQVLPVSRAAAFVAQKLPVELCAGELASGSVTMKNTGSDTWTQAKGYRLGTQSPQDNTVWGGNRVDLPANVSVASGQSFKFEFQFLAPTQPGTYAFQTRMLKEGTAWFGDLSKKLWIKVNACNPLLDPQRTSSFTWGKVSTTQIGGRSYLAVGGKPYFPKTDFLTAMEPGTSWKTDSSLFYLSMDSGKQAALRNTLAANGYNSIYVYTLNQGDGAYVVTPYGSSGWSLNVASPNNGRLNAWRSALEAALAANLKPFLFLAADDSSAIASMTDAQWHSYVDLMVARFGDLPIVWVVGLEVDEYWSYSTVKNRIAYLKQRSGHLVAVHLSVGASKATTSAWHTVGDVLMLQLGNGQNPLGVYKDQAAAYASTVRPTIAAEYNSSGTTRSKDIGSLLSTLGSYPWLAGLGNGVHL